MDPEQETPDQGGRIPDSGVRGEFPALDAALNTGHVACPVGGRDRRTRPFIVLARGPDRHGARDQAALRMCGITLTIARTVQQPGEHRTRGEVSSPVISVILPGPAMLCSTARPNRPSL